MIQVAVENPSLKVGHPHREMILWFNGTRHDWEQIHKYLHPDHSVRLYNLPSMGSSHVTEVRNTAPAPILIPPTGRVFE